MLNDRHSCRQSCGFFNDHLGACGRLPAHLIRTAPAQPPDMSYPAVFAMGTLQTTNQIRCCGHRVVGKWLRYCISKRRPVLAYENSTFVTMTDLHSGRRVGGGDGGGGGGGGGSGGTLGAAGGGVGRETGAGVCMDVLKEMCVDTSSGHAQQACRIKPSACNQCTLKEPGHGSRIFELLEVLVQHSCCLLRAAKCCGVVACCTHRCAFVQPAIRTLNIVGATRFQRRGASPK